VSGREAIGGWLRRDGFSAIAPVARQQWCGGADTRGRREQRERERGERETMVNGEISLLGEAARRGSRLGDRGRGGKEVGLT
jgi:hypothetical protein